MKWNVLIVEDVAIVRNRIKNVLEKEDINLNFATTKEEAFDLLSQNHYHAGIVDLYLPDMPPPGEEADGVVVIKKAKRFQPLIKLIILTAHDEKENILRCLRAGASDWVDKSEDSDFIEELRFRLKQMLFQYESDNGLASLLYHYTFTSGCPLSKNKGRCTETPTIHEGHNPKNVFVIIPSSDYGEEKKAIMATLSAAGMNPHIEEDDYHSTGALCSICTKIRQSPYAIADITGKTVITEQEKLYIPRPSVLYELGLAHALGRNVLILFQGSLENVPYDLRGHKISLYHQAGGQLKTAYLIEELCNWLEKIPRADSENVKVCREAARSDITNWSKKKNSINL